MLVRNLDFLSIPKEFSKVEIDIYENQSIALVYISNKTVQRYTLSAE